MKFIISLLKAINLIYDHAVTRVAGFMHSKVTEKASVAQVERAIHFMVPVVLLLMVYFAPLLLTKALYTFAFGLFFSSVLFSVLENGEKFLGGSRFTAAFPE